MTSSLRNSVSISQYSSRNQSGMTTSSKSSPPPSLSSSRSIMHSGRSVAKSSSKIPEKGSPVNVTPVEFKRVTITPKKMDNQFAAVDYDSKLKQLTDPKRIKPVSPEEKQEALSAMRNMFDDEEIVPNADRAPLLDTVNSLRDTVSTSKSVSVQKKTSSPKSDEFHFMFGETSFMDTEPSSFLSSNSNMQDSFHRVAQSTPFQSSSSGTKYAKDDDNEWTDSNAAVPTMIIPNSSVPPPIIPTQYRLSDRQSTNAAIDPGSFSSLLSALEQNWQQKIVVTPSLSRSLPRNEEDTPSYSHSTAKNIMKSDMNSLKNTPSFPSQSPSSFIVNNVPDNSVPLWTPSKSLISIDPTLQPHLDFLRDLEREFFPVSSSSASRAGQDDILRLWQRYMMLPLEQLEERVFVQHDAMVNMGIFEHQLSL